MITYDDIFVILATVAGVISLLMWGLGQHIVAEIRNRRK